MQTIRLDHSIRIAVDEYKLYMFWAAVILAISLAVRVALALFVEESGVIQVRPETFLRSFSQVFALVAGIINGVYAIRYFLRQGVTRHSFLLGGVLTGLAIAVTMQVIAAVLAVGAGLLAPVLPVELVPGQGPVVPGLLVGLILVLSLFVIGWIIGFTFCRFKVLAGMAAILAGLVVHGVLSSIWGENVHISIMGVTVPPIDGLATGAALALTAALMAGQLAVLYLMVRDAPLPVQ